MIVKLLTEHHLEFLSLKGGCRGSLRVYMPHVKVPHCWKSHAMAHLLNDQVWEGMSIEEHQDGWPGGQSWM